MTDAFITKMIDGGQMTEDSLCHLTPALASQDDLTAADMLIRIGRLELWRRWGFANIVDYMNQAGVSEKTKRCAILLMVIDDLRGLDDDVQGKMELDLEIGSLCFDRPLSLERNEFISRLERIELLQNRCRSGLASKKPTKLPL